MKAVIYQGPKQATLVSDRPLPKLRDDYILVKVVAVALNPTDWKHVEFGLPKEGGLIGVDFSGIVEDVGPKVTRPFKKGDRICGFAHGGNSNQPEDGTFAEYIVVKGDVQMKIPDKLSFEEAATLGCGVGTVGQGIYSEQGLQLSPPSRPVETPEPVLVYGGSTATGTLGIQFLKLSGYRVLTTCSPRNFGLVKSLGADQAFDYNDPECAKKIKEATNDKLRYAWDCIGLEESAKLCSEALSSGPDTHYGTILNAKPPRDDIKFTRTLAYTGLGEPIDKFGVHFDGNPEEFELFKRWTSEAIHYIGSGKVKVHPVGLRPDGLKGVLQGMAEMKEGKYSGEKLVYRVAETP